MEEKSSTPEPNTDDLALPNTFFTFDPQVPVQPPMGAPAGGTWIEDKYCGLISWVLCFVTGCCCIKCMCPCDTRNVSGKLRGDRGVRTACSTCSCIPRQHFACGRSIEASPQLDAVRSMIRHCRNFAPINNVVLQMSRVRLIFLLSDRPMPRGWLRFAPPLSDLSRSHLLDCFCTG